MKLLNIRDKIRNLKLKDYEKYCTVFNFILFFRGLKILTLSKIINIKDKITKLLNVLNFAPD